MDVFHRLSMHSSVRRPSGRVSGHQIGRNEQKQWKLTDFEIGKRLGKGKFGKVYCVREKKSGYICALKVMSKQEIFSYHVEKQIIREIEIQTNIKHKNCLALYGWFHDEQNIYLIIEYAAYGELYKTLTDIKRLDDKLASYYIYQVTQALIYLHSKHIVHRDLKPENILIHLNHQIKLADFGWSTYIPGINDKRTTMCGTLDYLPPEMVEAREHDHRVDVWALGILLYELLVGHPPFEESHTSNTYKRIAAVDFKLPNFIDPDAKDLLLKLLTYSINQRISLESVLVHRWIVKNSINWPL